MTVSSHPTRSASRFAHAFGMVIAAVLLLAACGGDSTTTADTDQVASVEAAKTVSDDAATEASSVSELEAAATDGASAATVTLSTGESFDLDVRTCETQTTDPNSLLNADFVDLAGQSADGQYSFTVGNATFAEDEQRRVQVGLSGERDENGVNPKIDYVNFGTTGDSTVSFVSVDGARVTGEAPLLAKFSQNKKFGETVTASFEFNCV